MKKFLKKFSETILAWKYMKKCIIIEKGGKRKILSRSYMIKDLLSFDYDYKELKRMSLPDLLYLYNGVSTGGTEVYNKETGESIYVGYTS